MCGGGLAGASFASIPGSLLGRNNEKVTSISAINDSVSEIIFRYVQSNRLDLRSSQDVRVDCGSAILSGAGCIAAVNTINALRKRAAERGVRGADSLDQYSDLVCRSCLVEGVSQNAVVTVKNQSEFELDLRNLIRTQLNGQLTQQLTNIRDVSGTLGGILGGSSLSCVASDITTRVVQRSESSNLSNLVTEIGAYQSARIRGDSIYVSRVAQDLTVKQISTFVLKHFETNQLFTTTELSAAQSLIAKNAALEDVANAVSGIVVDFAHIFDQAIGKIIIIAAALGILFIVLLILEPKLAQRYLQ